MIFGKGERSCTFCTEASFSEKAHKMGNLKIAMTGNNNAYRRA